MTKMCGMDKLKKIADIMQNGAYTCAIELKDGLYTSTERGVSPLLSLLDSGRDTVGAIASDKVVGKAAAHLYVKLGISSLFALVISRPALEVLRGAGISVKYNELAEAIRNRRGDGFCPMESAVIDISDTDEAIRAIRGRLLSLKNE